MPLPYLPQEIIHMVLQALVEDGRSLARFATVSREWQKMIEQHTFSRIRVTPPRIPQLNVMTSRNRARVRCIWLCIELERYDCTGCEGSSDYIFSTNIREDALIKAALQDIFVVLSSWEPNGSLSLDISVYSTSDPEHWFKYLTIQPDTLPRRGNHDQWLRQVVAHRDKDDQHRWDTLPTGLTPPMWAFDRVFARIMGGDIFDVYDDDDDDPDEKEAEWWRQLPLVSAVTCVQIRQQNRRRWKPQSLAEMLCRIPKLRELHYEPWREWDDGFQEDTDHFYLQLLESPALQGLSSLTIFENSNQKYTFAFHRLGCSRMRPPNSALGQALSKNSLNFASLSGSFLVDASDFFSFDEFERLPSWPNLTTLVLTSQLLAPDKSYTDVMDMLQAAGSAAIRMPRLKTMEIWNGQAKLAAVFRYELIQGGPSVVTWRGTWNLVLAPSVIKAWEAVTMRRSGYGLNVVYESLDGEDIISHGDAILSLGLPELVIRPISLHQILVEQEYSRMSNT